jgi:hypothetical protein
LLGAVFNYAGNAALENRKPAVAGIDAYFGMTPEMM